MSQALHETVDVAFGKDDPQPAQNKASPGYSNFIDGSGPIFSMYMEMATEEDKKMAEDWKADADGILIFTGLFSAAVASLISVSIQDLQQSPQDISNFYLANTYQATINPNISSSLPAAPPPFSTPNHAVWVNALWFLSLVISLTCALLATFLQQWARRYLKVTQSRYGPYKRARIRSFFAEGVDKCLLRWVVEFLPTLLHISLFLFFAGLVVFLSNINLTIFKLVLSWVSVCTALYGCITLMPIFRHDTPYYTSLSLLAWPVLLGLAFFISMASGLLLYFTVFCRRGGEWILEFAFRCSDKLSRGMEKTAEESALNAPSGIDARAFMWTFERSDEDHELERFFSGLPGFRGSTLVDDPLPNLILEQNWKLFATMANFMDRTLSSELLPESKQRRATICAKVIDPTHFPFAVDLFIRMLSRHQYSSPLVTDIVPIVKAWKTDEGKGTHPYAQAIILAIVARVQPRDDSWFILASGALSVAEAVLRDYSTHGDSLSFAVLIHLTRQQFTHCQNLFWPTSAFLLILQAASKFNAEDTSPELQHMFCTLWNEISHQMQNVDDQNQLALTILKPIHSVFVALHKLEHTDSAPRQLSASSSYIEPSYPVCTVPRHHPDSESASHIHDDAAPTASTRAVRIGWDDAAPFPSFHAGSLDVPSLFAHAPHCVDDSLADAPPLDNNILAPISEPLQPVDQTITESHRVPSTSPNLVTAHATHASESSGIQMTHHFTPEPSASLPSKSTSPPDIIAIEHVATSQTDLHLNVPSSASPALVHVLDDPASEVPTARSPSRLGTAVDGGDQGEDIAKTAEMGMPVDSLSLHEDIVVTPDVSSQSPNR